MNRFLTAVICLLTVAEYFSFYYVIFGKRVQVTRRKAIGLTAASLALVFWVWQEWVLDIRQGILFVICLFVMYFLFQVSFWENVKLWVSALAVLVIVEGMIDGVVVAYFKINMLEEMIIYLVCILVVLWIYYFLFGKKLTQGIFRLPMQMKGIIVAMVVVLVLMMSYMNHIISEMSNRNSVKVGVLFIFAGSMAVCILIFALIYYFNVTQDYSMQADMLEKQNEQQREYFEQLLKKEQDTRQFRHDLIAELLELKNYCDKGEYHKLESYLAEMLGSISEIGKRQYDVGNDIVNTIINYYFLPIRESCRISVKGYMGEEQTISQRELCIVVSNIVKNAVEAVEKMQEEPKEILFEVRQGKKTLNIHVENTMEGEIKKVDGLPVTTKEDKRNHGLGLRNVRDIVRKNDGSYDFKIENYYYIVDIFLKI